MAASGSAFDLGGFGSEELYAIAFLLEEEGFKYYDRVARASDDLRIRSEVGFLRDEEARHRAYFRGRLARQPEGEWADRARSFVRERFIEPLSAYYEGDRISKPGEALRFGAVLEQESIDFYSQLQRLERDETPRARIAEILAEERRHLKKIHQILAG